MSEKSFVFTSADSGADSYVFKLESAENNGRTIFAPGERARLKLYPGGRNPEITVTAGTSRLHSAKISQQVTEYIAFRDSDAGKTSFYVEKLISAVWEGTGTGRPSVYGTVIQLPDSTTGILKLSYETSYDLADVTSNKPTYILVSAKAEGLEGDFVLDFTEGYLTDVYNRDVVMTVKDACTREVLPDATVYVNEVYAGKTDSMGILRLGSMKTDTYSLKIVKEGYLDTDKDNIRNDWFTVE